MHGEDGDSNLDETGLDLRRFGELIGAREEAWIMRINRLGWRLGDYAEYGPGLAQMKMPEIPTCSKVFLGLGGF